ncbi:hypothetical protein BEP19_16505 [Ammoniphilus oxalaticus]|uniref:Uncharacterized protein n=1 Tax=Ammoniphilus oxalaticus TaxID=66863 RepID=A0A419SQX4_9BACL|nr:hypothetical protein [Ammoniphilus oxalaticus]RKD26797.1 hypothetical protein BEP19_16505 [Ammoniphilus oxalaticus]
METQTLRLSDIVLSVRPELYQLLTSQERELEIVLRQGISTVQPEDLLEIIEASIAYNKENDALH